MIRDFLLDDDSLNSGVMYFDKVRIRKAGTDHDALRLEEYNEHAGTSVGFMKNSVMDELYGGGVMIWESSEINLINNCIVRPLLFGIEVVQSSNVL